MLSRGAPDYTKTFNQYDKEARLKAKDNLFDFTHPTERTFRARVKYPKLSIVDNLNDSGVRVSAMDNAFSDIESNLNLGLSHNSQDVSPFNLGTVYNHELDHYVSYPTFEDADRYKKIFYTDILPDYYTTGNSNIINNNMTEIKARLGQLKDLMGKKGLEKTNMKELDAALEVIKNPKDYNLFPNNQVYDNNDNFFYLLKNKKALLKLFNDVNKNKTLTPFGLAGISYGIKKADSE